MMSLFLEERDKKALVRLQLLNKETKEVERELGFATKICVPDKQDPEEKNVLLITSASIFPDNIDEHLDDIVVHQWKAKSKQKDPAKVKNIENCKQADVSTVVFEGGDKKLYHTLQYKVLTEKDLKKKEHKKLSACVFEGKKKIVLDFGKEDGSYKLSNVSKKDFDVKRAKGAPVIIAELTHYFMSIPRYALKIVGVLSINSNGDLYPVLFKDGFLDESLSISDIAEAGPSGIDVKQSDERPSSSDTAEAGPSGIDKKQSGEDVQTKKPRTASDNRERDHAEDSNKLKEAIKGNTQNQPKFLDAHDVTSAKTDDIFTNVTVYYADKKQEKKEQAKGLSRREQLQEYTKRTAGFKVKKCEDIFIDKKRENPKTLLLIGKAGVGKTMFSEKVMRDWSMNRLFQNENTLNIKFAYLLKFRQLSSHGDKELNLHELLNCSPLLDDKSVIDDSLFEYLTKNPSEVLIILDGFDEYSEQHRKQIASDFEQKYPNDSRAKMPIPVLCSKLFKGKVFKNSVVLVCSRPGEAEDLRKINVDRYVEISGFSPEQVTEYVDKYFSEPEKERTKNTVREHVEKNENLVSFCHIPLLSFLLCWCLEWRITQSGMTENLPAKITDLYDEVVKVFVQKLHAHLKYLEMSGNTMKVAQETLDKLAELAANLLKESKYIFDEDDMIKLNLSQDEIENLKVSGILHCVPGIRISRLKTKAEYMFSHLTLREYLSASFFIKNKEIPNKEQVSGQTLVFMSGCLRGKDVKLMQNLIQQITPKDKYDNVNKLLMLQCLYEYGEDKLTELTINNLYDTYCHSNGLISFGGVTDVDMKYMSYLLDVIHLLKEQHPQSSSGHTLYISKSPLTSFGVGVVCDSLVRNSFITGLRLKGCSLDDKCVEKISESLVNTGITYLDLGMNDITDEGTKSICRVIIQDDCHVQLLSLLGNEKITAECEDRLTQLVQKHKPGVRLYFEANIGAIEKEPYRREEEEQAIESISDYHPNYSESATSPFVSRTNALAISYKQDEAIIELTQDGGRCDVSKYGALLEFSQNTVESQTHVVCKVCPRESTPSPEGDVMETLVSHLVQLGPSSVELQEPVIVTLLHAGPGKKSGYETIVKAFNNEEKVWKEIEEFKDASHIPQNYKPGNVIQVKISKLTSLAVISRLITDKFEVTPAGCVVRSSVCNDVTVTFPEGAVDKTITGSMKLVLLPEMIFLFSGFKDIEFLEPVTVRFPYRGSTGDFPGRLRVLFQKGSVNPHWNDFTGNAKLEKKEPGFLELHVQHFCRLTVSEPISDWWRSPQQVFLGAFKENNDSLKLTIVCASFFSDIENYLKGLGYERLAVSTSAEMRHSQMAYVQVKNGLDIQTLTDGKVFVKFIEGGMYREELVYSINTNNFQNHAASREAPLYLYFYPNTEYVEEERIGRLAIDRSRLYPKTEESMDIDPTEESMDVDEGPQMDENQNSFVAPTRCLEDIPPRHRPESIDHVYKMTSSPRGVSYIINMKKFAIHPFHKMYDQLDDRLGSESDVDSLSRLFKGLNFKVEPLWDLNKSDLDAKLQSISESDFSSYDCLVVFLMSHGKDNCIYASDGEIVRLEDIFDMLEKCRTLQRKPKLFFIQACRETVADPGVIYSDGPNDQEENTNGSDLNPRTYPEYCDHLHAFSCYEGHLSYRWQDQGSFYVQSLVEVFREHSCKEDVLSMLTIVNRKVSELGYINAQQIPCPKHTLTKLVYFWPGLSFPNP